MRHPIPPSLTRREALRLFALAAGSSGLPLAGGEAAATGQTRTLELTWHDEKRQRDVPAKLYLPAEPAGDSRWPIVLFSHGLGGSRHGYSYLGEAWSAVGYLSVHVQHAGSDSAALRGTRPRTCSGST